MGANDGSGNGSDGGDGGDGGTGGHMVINGGSIGIMAGSNLEANGGSGGWGGNGLGHNAIYTLTDHWDVNIAVELPRFLQRRPDHGFAGDTPGFFTG